MASSSSSITRPAYVQDMIDSMYNEVMNISPSQWVNKQYAGLNEWEQNAINELANSSYLQDFTQALSGMGSSGADMMKNAWSGMQQMYQNGPLSASDITNEASQLYDEQAVQNAQVAANNKIYQTGGNQLASQAQQNMNQGAFTSGAVNQQNATLSNTLSSIGTTDSGIANQAYNTALKEATGLLTGQRKMQMGALSGMGRLGKSEIQAALSGAQMGNKAIANEWKAGLLQQMANQGQNDMNYFNAKGNQNMPWYYVDQMLKAAGVINSASGTNRTTNTSTSVSGGGLF